MTRTRHGIEDTDQSTDQNTGRNLGGRRINKRRCPWGITCKSQEANNKQGSRSSSSVTEDFFRQFELNNNWVPMNLYLRCDGIQNCYNSSSPWIVMKALQLNASSYGVDEEHFQDACFKETSEQLSCQESCVGVYRTFTGCCNNLINTEYGQIIKFYLPNISEFPCRKYQHSSQEVFQHSGLSVGNTAQRGTYRL